MTEGRCLVFTEMGVQNSELTCLTCLFSVPEGLISIRGFIRQDRALQAGISGLKAFSLTAVSKGSNSGCRSTAGGMLRCWPNSACLRNTTEASLLFWSSYTRAA